MPPDKGKMNCFASSTCSRSFKEVTAILAHLESGGCQSGITLQDLHHLICQAPTAKLLIIPDRLPWFRAGPPRNEVRDIDDFDQSTQQWRCSYCLTVCRTKAQLVRHFFQRTCSSAYPNTLQCPTCQKGCVKLSELVTHCKSKKCSVRADPKNIYGPVLNYLERALALWRPNANQEPRIEYRLRCNSVESPRMMVHVIELPPSRAAYNSITNGKSPDNKSPGKDIAMLENNVEASSSANGITRPVNSNEKTHLSSIDTSPLKLYDDYHFEVTPRLMISAGSPGDTSQPADLPIVTQQMGSCEISEGKTTNSFFPSTSSDTSFLTNPSDALERSQQMGEPLSVPMKIKRRLEAVLSGTETDSPYSGTTSSAWGTVSRRSKPSDLTASSESRENRFHRKYHPRNDGGSTHRDRRQHESQMALALTSQEQELSQDQSSNENELDEDSTDDDDSGGVPL
ncbi:MAG: hypothetical protein Q9228_002684 [Teloschistes exilis]